MKSIVIIDDDFLVSEEISRSLSEVFKVPVETYDSAENFFYSSPKANTVYLVDWHLPGSNGSEIVQAIREHDKISSIFMISGDNSLENIKTGLSVGADDYIIKPFESDVLISKINNARTRAKAILDQSLNFGVKLIPEAGVIIRNGKRVSLTDREFEIFKCLHDNLNQVNGRHSIIPLLKENDISIRSVDHFVFNLRKKILPLGYQIDTVRGEGYKMVEV